MADAAVHACALGFALFGILLFALVQPQLSPGEIAAVSIYLVTLVCSISVSAAYNLWPVSGAKWILRRFDHSAIYWLIAGTYTPFVVRSGAWGLLAFVWIVAGIGAGLKLLLPGRFDRVSIGLYLALGWSGVLVTDQLVRTLPAAALWLIGAGGLFYTSGVVFHLWERLKFQNAIWHAFVLTGASIHYAAVWSLVKTA